MANRGLENLAEDRVERRLAAILAADVAGYSRLMGADEEGTLRALTAHRRELIDPKVAEHRGRIVKTTGDGALVEFASVVDAVRCAVEIQRAMADRNADVPQDKRVEIRIGINVGDIIIQGDDIFGDGVNVAARLEGLAEPGGICVSRAVRDQVQDKLSFAFDSMGEQTVKNIARPIRVYRVKLGDGTGVKAVSAERRQAPSAASDKPSIAVLPFQNMSDDPEQQYFADGIAEDLITDLSKVSGLTVIARNSSFAYRDRAGDLRVVAKELDVRHLLEGSVRKAGGRVRVTAQLIDGGTGAHLWAERYDRDLTDVFAVQDEVTRAIVDALRIHLTPAESARVGRRGTADIDAYDLYVRGRQQLRRYTKASTIEARRLFEQAIALDPNFAAAYACAALAVKNERMNQVAADPAAADALIRSYGEKAASLDPDEPTIHWLRALDGLSQRRHAEAEREASELLRVEPSSDFAHSLLAQILVHAGRPAEAVPHLEQAMRLDPHFPDLYLHVLGHAYLLLRDWPRAEDALRRRIRRNPTTDSSRLLLASLLGHQDRPDEARAEWAELMRHHPSFVLADRRKGWFYKDPADEEFVVEGLRKAGVAD